MKNVTSLTVVGGGTAGLISALILKEMSLVMMSFKASWTVMEKMRRFIKM